MKKAARFLCVALCGLSILGSSFPVSASGYREHAGVGFYQDDEEETTAQTETEETEQTDQTDKSGNSNGTREKTGSGTGIYNKSKFPQTGEVGGNHLAFIGTMLLIVVAMVVMGGAKKWQESKNTDQ